MSVYRVTNREESSEEFDTGETYEKVFGEVRIWPSGDRDPVVGVGEFDIPIHDLPLLVAALLERYTSLLYSENLQSRAVPRD